MTAPGPYTVKILWISDIHMAEGQTVFGTDPSRNLARAVEMIRRDHGDAVACVVSGDMAENGLPENYRLLAEGLSGLPMPVLPMVGNHDDREALRAAFALPDGAMDGFVQYRVDRDELSLIALDTIIPGEAGGELCPARRQWLADELSTTPDVPVLVFMHHPPMQLGLPMQDMDCCAGGEEVLDLLAEAGNVAHLFCGHVHRPVSGVVRGMPFATLRSLTVQAPAPWPAWAWDNFTPVEENPAIGVVLVRGRDVILQPIDVPREAA